MQELSNGKLTQQLALQLLFNTRSGLYIVMYNNMGVFGRGMVIGFWGKNEKLTYKGKILTRWKGRKLHQKSGKMPKNAPS